MYRRDIEAETYAQFLGFVAGSDAGLNDREREYYHRTISSFSTDLDLCLEFFEREAKNTDRETLQLGLMLKVILSNVTDKEKFIKTMEGMAVCDGDLNKSERIVLSAIRDQLGVPNEDPCRVDDDVVLKDFDYAEFLAAEREVEGPSFDPRLTKMDDILKECKRMYDINLPSYRLNRPFAINVFRHLAKAGYLPAKKIVGE